MSLSSWEQQILSRIAEELARTDARLASLATGFNRLAASEDMPPRPQVAGVRQGRYRRGTRHSARASWLFMTVWLVTTAGLIASALVLNVVGHGTSGNRGCMQTWAVSCTAKQSGT